MTIRRFPILLMLCLALPSAWASGVAAGVDFRTGDVEFDAYLEDLNVHAGGNLDGYVDHVALSYNVPRERVIDLVDRYPPADVYLMVGYSHHLSVGLDLVERTYRQHRGEGWGVIAKELGVQPGSAAFHALKSGARSDRGGDWKGGSKGKPPGHGKGKEKNAGKGKGKDR